MYVYVPTQPSERSRALGRDLTRAIEQFQRSNPGTTSMEIHQALQLAKAQTGAGRGQAVLVGLMLAGVLVGLVFMLLLRGR
jgi:hypothetical protein